MEKKNSVSKTKTSIASAKTTTSSKSTTSKNGMPKKTNAISKTSTVSKTNAQNKKPTAAKANVSDKSSIKSKTNAINKNNTTVRNSAPNKKDLPNKTISKINNADVSNNSPTPIKTPITSKTQIGKFASKKVFIAILMCLTIIATSTLSAILVNKFYNTTPYDIAVNNGFQGTEQEWLNSLKGNCGEVGNGISKIEKTATNNEEDTYTITFTDNTSTSFTVKNGINGDDGVGIKSASINQNNELIITLSNNNKLNLGNVKGNTGRGISSIEKTATNGLIDTYIITYSDSTQFTYYVTNGEKGDDGLGIKSIVKSSTNNLVDTYTITYTDDTTSSFTITNGAKGNGINKVEKISSNENIDTYKITFTDESTFNFTVTNGLNGENAIAVEKLTIDRLNAKLATIDLDSNKTLYDRFNAANITNKQLKALTQTYLYSYLDNEFIAVDGVGSVAYTTSILANYSIGKDVIEDINLYSFVSSNNLSEDHSNYLVSGTATVLNISSGLDVGEMSNISEIIYTNSSDAAKNIIIRTNKANTSISINAPLDSIKHYGLAGAVDIQQISLTSYFEYGSVGFVELSIGRIVLTESSNVNTINITKNSENTYNNPIIANGGVLEKNMPEIISRDPVTVIASEGKTELVQIQKTDVNGNVIDIIEQIYAYAHTSDGTTEKISTGENKQNENINSTLGKIVLDSESTPGEKSYSSTQKSENKESAVQSVVKASKYGGGRGTPTNPYLINSIEHLYAMSEDYVYNDLIEEYCNFNCYQLTTDLTVKNWTIATIHYIQLSQESVMPYCNAFGGQFDGNNHTIKFIWDSSVTEVDSNDGVALFGEFIDSLGIEGYDRPGIMKNLTIDCDINTTCDISPMFAYIWGDDCTIENCHIKGTIKSDGYTGGISLYSNVSCLIKDCTFDADVYVQVEESTSRNNNYFYLSTFVNQVKRNPIQFVNCKVNGSINLPYCADINLVIYGTFYTSYSTNATTCNGTGCIDNCTVNISEDYANNSKQLVRCELNVVNS